ncbi:hypothetical protein CHD5UKE2_032 [Escherichia phage vB_EcoS-CHD5UKE2]|uniref:Uncharacterized protein n=1 Tax=Escherichia phage vB_EcoS-CHD5UKE2 TaxID=2865806 RepID=A0A9E7SH71_9CAUD|nr:hypothetical protein P9604_gp31 [Escherichia phage vB_EcoS-CHD5UKE2]USL86357.1 hypothetical protein CHD5UKE2_032 [Escherichia phage vB_EcoS-CHD5UKE2]
MRLLFRRKSDGRILKPIQTLEAYVRLHHEASDKVWWAKKDKLSENFDVLTHDIERGDVLRDIRDGQLWVVEYTGQHGLRMKAGILLKGMTYFGLIHFERVGRKYNKRDHQPHERPNTIADAINRITREVAQKTRVEFRKSQPAYATYDASKVQEAIRSTTREIVNRFDAVTNAQRMARDYGVAFIRVEYDGSMTAVHPQKIIQK